MELFHLMEYMAYFTWNFIRFLGTLNSLSKKFFIFFYIFLYFLQVPRSTRKFIFPLILDYLHDRYPAIYVNDHIWKCTADFLSLLVSLAAILKSEAVLAVFSVSFNSLEGTFHD